MYKSWSHEMEYRRRLQGLRRLVVPLDPPDAEGKITTLETTGMYLRSGLQLRASGSTGPRRGASRDDTAIKINKTAGEAATGQEDEVLLLGRALSAQQTRADCACFVIMLNVREHPSAKLRHQRTAQDLLTSLREELKPRKRSREVTRRRQLNSSAMGSNKSLSCYFNRAWDLGSLSQDIDIVVDDGCLLGALLSGLSDKYERTMESMEERDDITVCKPLAMLHAADARTERRVLSKKAERVGGVTLVADGEEDRRARREAHREMRCH